MTLKLSSEDAKSWDAYAAAALAVAMPDAESPEQAVAVAVQLADLLMAERKARRDAHFRSDSR